jgi:hypothetical protein
MDDCSAQVFPYNIFAYCSICRVDCKFARNKIKKNVCVFDLIQTDVSKSGVPASLLMVGNKWSAVRWVLLDATPPPLREIGPQGSYGGQSSSENSVLPFANC